MDDAERESRRATTRLALLESRGALRKIRDVRAALIREAAELGIPKTEIAELAGISRDTVYDVLGKGGVN